MTPAVSDTDGGYMVQPMAPENLAPAQVIVINPPDVVGNPWAQPTAYRPDTDRFIGPEVHPALKYSNPGVSGSQYAPSVVIPAGVPQYGAKRVVDPVPAVAASALPAGG
jgi:hypothetical protein